MQARFRANKVSRWLLLSAVLTAQLCAAQFWEKKPYQQWSKDDTQKMLSDSPWAREVVLSGTNTTSNLTSKLATGTANTGARVTYQVQLRTAKPIRQAIVREQQFNPRYQQLPPERKQAVDASAEQFINAHSDELVFWVNYTCDIQNLNTDLVRYWSTQTAATLTNTVFLKISGQDKVMPTAFAPGPGQSFEIHFARPAEIPADASMVLEFRHPSGLAGVTMSRVAAEFKTKKMGLESAAAK